jgi:protoheme IX farnesyltransferase
MLVLTSLFGFYLATPGPSGGALLANVLAGTALSCAGAGALNMAMERRADGAMHRTRNRPVPAGRLATGTAVSFGGILATAGVALLAVKVNMLTAGLSLATLVLYLLVYTPLKSRTSLCTVIGAIPGALPPVMGWTAATGSLAPGAWALFGVLFFWQLPHFLAIAWMYREDYARAGYPMLPVVDPGWEWRGRRPADAGARPHQPGAGVARARRRAYRRAPRPRLSPSRSASPSRWCGRASGRADSSSRRSRIFPACLSFA